MSTPTAYIQASTTGKDKPPPGWVIVLTKEGKGMHFYCTGADISYITMRDQYDWWLKPIDLSRMLEEAWEAGAQSESNCIKPEGDCGYDATQHEVDKINYLKSVLNPPK